MSPAPSTRPVPVTEPGHRHSGREQRRTLIGTGIGNALEWYDWHVYGIFAPFFAQQFFNPDNELSALLSTLAIFAVGFAMRPIGAFVFGRLADRKGRRLAMLLSIGMGSAGSLAIGLAPTYASIGAVASLILLLARLTQGMAHGGELPSSQTYLAETAPPERRGRWTSAIYVSGACGMLIATLLGAGLAALYGTEALEAWGWRVPFVIGGLLGVYALFLRRKLTETHAFNKERTSRSAAPQRPSVLRGMWQNRAAAGRVIGLTAGFTVTYQAWTTAAPTYAISVTKLDSTAVLLAEVVALLIFIVALPLCGSLSDRFGRRPNMLIFVLGMAVLAYPLLLLARAGRVWQLGLAMTIALLFTAMCASIAPAIFAELFPTNVRTTGTGVPYAIAVALFGGTTPYLQTWLASHHAQNYFTGYNIALLLIGALVVLTGPETRAKPLE
ncbi:MFS transporter [Streptomyces sioyaensis]|uniref:MFS transporter n=1 Tax=Streptomyces sioyaensis TaxID=67364 RepID=UPI001C2BED99|nr:MFS transporter [Streptomyces sioyaensis]